jgi:hypothetical protein
LAANGPLVDLLHATPAQVAVSSSVDNPKDKPDHLVDGKLQTAWNGRTGDLDGWIAFRVPEDASIEALELTVGFDRVMGDTDLFTANHRIAKVAVATHDVDSNSCIRKRGDASAEQTFALDVAKRGLTRIPFRARGGAYCVFVLETVPGTTKAWKELAVSELRVLGLAGATLRDPADPIDIDVGLLAAPWQRAELPPFEEGRDTDLSDELNDENLEIARRSYRDVTSLCRDYVIGNTKRANGTKGGPYPADPVTVACREVTAKEEPALARFTPAGPFVGARMVETKDGFATFRYVVAQTAEGFWLTPIVTSFAWYTEPQEGSSGWDIRGLDALRVDGKNLVALQTWSYSDRWPRTRTEPTFARGASWCTPGAGGKRSCMQWHPDVAPPLGLRRKPGVRDAGVVANLPWEGEVAFMIGDDARLRRSR